MIKFSYTIFYVEDVARSIEFYERAFGFKRKFVGPENDYGELDTGATILSFAAVSLAEKNLPKGFVKSKLKEIPFGFEIGITTPDVEKVYRESVNAGAVPVQEAKVKPWGQTVAYVRDPDGFLIEICTPMS